MYFLGFLCLLSAAVALPTPEQLHTNLPALPPPPELKPEDRDEPVEQVIVDPPVQNPSDIPIEEPVKSDKSEKSKEDNDKAQDKPDEKVIQKNSKESKESKNSKEKPKEFKESEELNDHPEIRPEETQEEKKENELKLEEPKERFDDDVPVIVEVIKRPKGSLADWFTRFIQSIPWPIKWWPYSQSGFRNGDAPIYLEKESDLDFD